MRCDELRALLDLYMDGELPEETARKLDRHLLRCQTCAYELRTLEQTQAMLRATVAPTEASPAFRERAAAHLARVFEDRLKPPHAAASARQWTLPLMREELP